MIAALQRYLSGIPPVFLDGCLAVGIAVMTALTMSLATDDSAKYIDPKVRFFLVGAIGAINQGLHALSKFRDKSYSTHIEERKNGNGNGHPKPT